MCIIVAKDKKANLPKKEYLQNCFENNSDGAGFMYVDNNNVIIDKGYMNYKSFEKHYDKLCKKYNNFKNKALVFHFRIGTSGNNTPNNCHPFPIGKNTLDLKKTYNTCKLGVVHNGIISDYVIRGTNEYDLSDTMNFIDTFLSPLYKGFNEFYKNDNILKGISNLITSKLCLLDTNENLYFVGDFTEEEGIKYSNTTYKYKKYYSSCYDSYSWENLWKSETKKEETKKETPKETKKSLYKLPHGCKYIDDYSNTMYVYTDNYFLDKMENILYYKNYDGKYTQIAKAPVIFDKYERLINY